MSQIEKLNVLNFFSLNTSRVTEMLDLPATQLALSELLAKKQRLGQKAGWEIAPEKFNFIAPTIFQNYGGINGSSRQGFQESNMGFIRWDRYLASCDEAIGSISRIGKVPGVLSQAARFVNYYRPQLSGGREIRIFFLGSYREEGKHHFAPCLEINTKGSYLRDEYLAGFSTDTWFAIYIK